MINFEHQFWQAGFKKIIGIDEAGRGPLAGPVCIAGVIFDSSKTIPTGINDSKKLSATQRENLFEKIKKAAASYKIVFISEKQIDTLNILNAVKKGALTIVKALKPDFILTDAFNFNFRDVPQLALTKGDNKSVSIAAASILAKVSRDRKMTEFSKKYPEYHFEKHAGYATKKHVIAINQHGLSPIHRKSFKIPNY